MSRRWNFQTQIYYFTLHIVQVQLQREFSCCSMLCIVNIIFPLINVFSKDSSRIEECMEQHILQHLFLQHLTLPYNTRYNFKQCTFIILSSNLLLQKNENFLVEKLNDRRWWCEEHPYASKPELLCLKSSFCCYTSYLTELGHTDS